MSDQKASKKNVRYLGSVAISNATAAYVAIDTHC